MTASSTLPARLWSAFVAIALLAVIALHGIGPEPIVADTSQGSAFSAYSHDVAVVTSRSEAARHLTAEPTPVPPLPPFDAGFDPDYLVFAGPGPAIAAIGPPPLARLRTPISFPRAPPAA